MTSPTFPHTEPVTVGEFWLSSEPGKTTLRSEVQEATRSTPPVEPNPGGLGDSSEAAAFSATELPTGGMCRIDRDLIEVDIVGALTPGSIRRANGTQTSMVPATEQYDFTVHASLPVAPWSASFLGCRTVSRRGNALRMLSGKNTHQVVHATWAVTGAHVTPETTFSGFRVEVTGLEEWAGTPGLEQTVTTAPPLSSTISWTTPERREVEFNQFDQTALLACESSAKFAAIDVHGSHVETTNRLTLSGIDGWTLQDALSRFIVPIQTLMGLLTGRHARIRSLEVQVDGVWCQTYGPLVAHEEQSSQHGLRDVAPILLDHHTLGLENMARWCASTVDLSPAPHVVAAALSGEFVTVEAEALTLTTTAEGLDRRLHPRQRRFDAETVEWAREQLQSFDIDETLRMALTNSLAYIHEPSMPQRLERLAQCVATAAPDCIGRTNRWKRQVTDMRITGAHGLENGSKDDDGLLRLHALARSLRWALRIRLLQECGIADASITKALASSTEYGRDRRHWHAQLPAVFQVE